MHKWGHKWGQSKNTVEVLYFYPDPICVTPFVCFYPNCALARILFEAAESQRKRLVLFSQHFQFL